MKHKRKMNTLLAIEDGTLEIERDLEVTISFKKQKTTHDEASENGKFKSNSYFSLL